MNTKLQQTSLNQTGMAIYLTKGNNKLFVPLFSYEPTVEAHQIARYTPIIDKIINVFYTNKITNEYLPNHIREFLNKTNSLPRNYMDELRSGFSNIHNSLEFGSDTTLLPYS